PPDPNNNFDRRKNQGGTSCLRAPVFMTDVIGTLSHELGHQFSAFHTWSRCNGPGEGLGFAVEPGGGNTIMGYGEICGGNSYSTTNPYFHSVSIQQIKNYSRGSLGAICPTEVATENLSPSVTLDYENGFVIPVSTPFRLVGQATDLNNDELTFNWEQIDTDLSFSPLGAPVGNAPIFRSLPPSADGWQRYFPRLDLIVRNTDNLVERLPTYSRDLNFRLTARDNNTAAGATDWQQVSFRADEAAGPFVVSNPDTISWHVGDYTEVRWDVANTNLPPVNSQLVDILLSTDGGQTFDIVLAEDAANTGSAFITVPELPESDQARSLVAAADNVFLNVNSSDFNILPATAPGFTLEQDLRYADLCLPEVVNVTLSSGSILGFDQPIALSLDEESLPENLLASFSAETIAPGASSMLSLDLSGLVMNDTIEVIVLAVAEGLDTASRTIRLEVTSTDYSDLILTEPIEGTAGVILSANFTWADAVNANVYDIEIATSPTFAEGTIFDQAAGLVDPTFRPEDFFENNTIYYWRVRGSNRCGLGEWTRTQSFRTANSACNDFSYTGSPVGLPGSGPSFVRESPLFIEQSGTISDVNIPNVNVQYNFASNVTITLVSPAGTRVELYKENCFSTNRIDLGFDDDAPIAVACPPDDQRVFIPVGNLSDFIGEETLGEWILEVAVSETGGSAGSIQSWDIEFCADVASTPPQAINNNATEVPPLQRNVIIKDNLSVTSAAFMNEFVQYTITDLPDAGRLLLYGTEVMVGDTFQQDDINGLGLFYENTDDSFDTDDFGFLVTTPDGGYLPIMYHDIIITEDAVVSNRPESVLDASLQAFPNPVAEALNVRWGIALNKSLTLELFDLNGRMLKQKTVAGTARAATLNMAMLPAGVYLLRIEGAVRRIVKK
ncbi:MAG: T9SS type A sorting domain-containing protein, partial [Bacteroidota bacterium]